MEVPVGVGSKTRLTIVASLRDVVGRSDDNEMLLAGHDIVCVLLHSNLCKPLLYRCLSSFIPVPDLSRFLLVPIRAPSRISLFSMTDTYHGCSLIQNKAR